jgi:hypothetical protein
MPLWKVLSTISRRKTAMATIQPKGEKVRQAVKWISSEKTEHPQKDMASLLREAALRFNLSPREEGFLFDFYKEEGGPSAI